MTYVAVEADGDGQSDASFRGAAALTNVSVSSFSEWRVSRVVALTLLLRGMVYRGNAHMRGSFTRNGTDVEVDVGAEDPLPRHRRLRGSGREPQLFARQPRVRRGLRQLLAASRAVPGDQAEPGASCEFLRALLTLAVSYPPRGTSVPGAR
ncbi:MAG: hypothetical protein WDO74_00915 [Pseudomonadota bacterium]